MPVFEITTPTEARLASVTPRVEKHGDDDKPALTLALEIETANTVLDSIDPTIRQALYKAKPEETPELPGVDASTPVLRCNSVDRVKLTTAHEGWTLHVHDSVDSKKPPMAFGGVKVDQFSVEPKQGGTVVLRLRLGTSDVDAKRIGWLGVHNGQPITVALLAPKVSDQPASNGNGAAKGPDATDLFVGEGGKPGPDEGDSEGGETDAKEPQRGEGWPFPKPDAGAAEQPSQELTHERLRKEPAKKAARTKVKPPARGNGKTKPARSGARA